MKNSIIVGLFTLFLMGCQVRPTGVTFEQMETMPPFEAKVLDVDVRAIDHAKTNMMVTITLLDSNSKRISVATISHDPNTPAFAHFLKVGAKYKFPLVWQDFKARASSGMSL